VSFLLIYDLICGVFCDLFLCFEIKLSECSVFIFYMLVNQAVCHKSLLIENEAFSLSLSERFLTPQIPKFIKQIIIVLAFGVGLDYHIQV